MGYTTDAWTPGWSRLDWTESDGEMFYCESSYGLESEAEAIAATPGDATDISAGCGGFNWTWIWESTL